MVNYTQTLKKVIEELKSRKSSEFEDIKELLTGMNPDEQNIFMNKAVKSGALEENRLGKFAVKLGPNANDFSDDFDLE